MGSPESTLYRQSPCRAGRSKARQSSDKDTNPQIRRGWPQPSPAQAAKDYASQGPSRNSQAQKGKVRRGSPLFASPQGVSSDTAAPPEGSKQSSDPRLPKPEPAQN